MTQSPSERREKRRLASAAYRAANKDKTAAYRATYYTACYEANRDKIAAKKAARKEVRRGMS